MPIKRLTFMVIVLVLGLSFTAGCGWFSRKKTLPFRTDLKLKVAVAPFDNLAGRGGGYIERQANARMVEELARSRRLIIVPGEKVAAYMEQNQIKPPFTNNMAAMVGRSMGVNAVVLGAISDVSQVQRRVGWFWWLTFITSPKDLIEVALAAKAVDSESSVTLATVTSTGVAKTGQTLDDLTIGNPTRGVDPQFLTDSMKQAVDDMAEKLIDELAQTTWKGFIVKAEGSRVVLSAGKDVGIRRGDRFAILDVGEKITNAAGQTYIIPGPIKTHLEAVEVDAETSVLKVISGQANFGDAVLALR